MDKIQRRVIDVHTHVFPDKLAIRAADNIVNYYSIPRKGDGTVARLLAERDGFCDLSFVISSAAIKPSSASAGNDFLLQTASENPGVCYPLCSFHPDMGVSAACAELERCKSLGALGVKLHPDFQHFDIDTPDAMPIYRFCAELKLPILFHVGDEHTDFTTPTRLRRVHDAIPDLEIIAAHMCGYRAWDEAEHVLIGSGVWCDTSEALRFLPAERVYDLIERHGADRVLFGSDYPLHLPGREFADLDALPLTEREKDMIYFENTEKVFGIKKKVTRI